MNILYYTNSLCPNLKKGECHAHSRRKQPNSLISCVFCNETLLEHIIYPHNECKHYLKEIPFNSSKAKELSIFYLREGGLPQEIIDIIINTRIYQSKNVELNENGIDHIMSCVHCSFNFLEWIDKNSCSHHILPRLAQHT